MKRVTIVLAFVTMFLGAPNALGQMEGIAIIKQVRNCRVALTGMDSNRSSQLLRTQGGETDEYQVLVKSAANGKLETIAILKRDPKPSVTTRPSLPYLPYLITGGTILQTKAGARPDCSSLLGMTATPVPTHAAMVTEPERSGFVASINDEATVLAPESAADTLPTANIPEPAPSPTQAEIPAVLQQVSHLVSDNRNTPWFPSIVSIEAGARTLQLRTAGLKIDSNESQSLNLIGHATRVSFYPAALLARVSKLGPAAEWLIPLHMGYTASMQSSMKPIAIERNGIVTGSQESSLRIQSISLGYDFIYFQDQIRTSIHVTPWSTEKLQSNLRSFSDPLPNTLRDLEISCVGLGLTQAFQFTSGIDVALALTGCVQNESKTPTNSRAEFPNQREKFSQTKVMGTSLKTQFPLAVPSITKQADDFPLYLTLEFGAQRWQGSLELDDKQIIDAEATKLSVTLGLGLAIH